jgi:serine phosphatase RsbU (regulator of sigma subunit)
MLEGTVHGYRFEPPKGLLKREKPAVLEGTLDKAQIEVFRDNTLVSTENTNAQGMYSIPLSANYLYVIRVSKEGYNRQELYFDTRALPQNIQDKGYKFIGLEFILNSYKQGSDRGLDRKLGRVFWSPPQKAWQLAKTAGDPAQEVDAPVELLERSLEKNTLRVQQNTGFLNQRRIAQSSALTVPEFVNTDSLDSAKIARLVQRERSLTISKKFDYNLNSTQTSDQNLADKEENIRLAKEQLAMDKLLSRTKMDSLTILQREAQIEFAEQEIETAQKLIDQQNQAMSAQRQSLVLLAVLLVVVLATLGLIIFFYRQRQQSIKLIEEKNRQITDSLTYAQRIQQSVFTDEYLLQEAIPESFILSKPKDIVSGDFFFFHQFENKFLVGVADCTGHGVPGAFMSLIGNRLLREIIKERKIYDPAQILLELDRGIKESFSNQTNKQVVEDGMDIAICQIDPDSRTLTFAAAMNPAYLVTKDQIEILQADVASVGGQLLRRRRKPKPKTFTNKAVTYSPDAMLYMFTDGYMDQFGEAEDEKFNTRRFKEMVVDIQHHNRHSQVNIAEQTFNDWKGARDQTDDVLLLGIRLP